MRALASNAGTAVENGASTADAPTAGSSFAISTKRTISISQRAVVNKLLSTGIAARRGKPGGKEAVERLISGFWTHPLVRKRLPELKRLIDLSESNPSQYRVKLAAYVADLRDYVHFKGQLKGWHALIGQKAPGWAKAKRKVMRRYRAAMFNGDRAGVEKYTSLMAALALVKTRNIDELKSDGTELSIDGDKKSVAGVVTGGRKLFEKALLPFVQEVGAEQVKTEAFKKYAATQARRFRLVGDIKDTYGIMADIRSGDAKRRMRALKKLSKVLKGLSADDLAGMMDMDRMSSKAGVLGMLKAHEKRIADSRVKLACVDPQSGRCQAALYRQRALNRPFGTPRRTASPFANMVHPAVRAIRAGKHQQYAQHLKRSRLLSLMRSVVANQEYVVGAKGNKATLGLFDPLEGYRPVSSFPMKGRMPKRLTAPHRKASEEELRWQRVELVATFVHELKRNEFIRPVVRMAEEAKGLDGERARMGRLIADLRHLPPDKLVDRLPHLTFWAQTGAMLAAAAKLEKAAPDIQKAHAKTAGILRRAAKIMTFGIADPEKMPEVDIAPYTRDVRKHLIRARELMMKKEKGTLTKAEATEFARSLRLAALHFDHATTFAKDASEFIDTGQWWIGGVSVVIMLEAIGATILATAAIPETGGASATAVGKSVALLKFAFANLVAAFTFTAVHTAGNVAIMGEEFSFKHFGYDLAWNFAVFMALGGVMRGAGRGVGKLRPEQMAKAFEEAGINYKSARFLQKLAVKYNLPEGTKLGEALVTALGKETALLGTELATFQGMETLKLATAAQGLTTRERPDFGEGFGELWSGKSLLHGLLMIAGIRGFNYTLSRATGKVRGAEIKKHNEQLKAQIAFLEKGEMGGRKLTTLARARLEKAIIGRMGRIGRLGGAVEKGSVDTFKKLIGYDEASQTFKPTVVREVTDGKGLAEEVGDVFGLSKEGASEFAKGIDASGLTRHELAYLQEAIAHRQVEGSSLIRDYRINRLLAKAGYRVVTEDGAAILASVEPRSSKGRGLSLSRKGKGVAAATAAGLGLPMMAGLNWLAWYDARLRELESRFGGSERGRDLEAPVKPDADGKRPSFLDLRLQDFLETTPSSRRHGSRALIMKIIDGRSFDRDAFLRGDAYERKKKFVIVPDEAAARELHDKVAMLEGNKDYELITLARYVARKRVDLTIRRTLADRSKGPTKGSRLVIFKDRADRKKLLRFAKRVEEHLADEAVYRPAYQRTDTPPDVVAEALYDMMSKVKDDGAMQRRDPNLYRFNKYRKEVQKYELDEWRWKRRPYLDSRVHQDSRWEAEWKVEAERLRKRIAKHDAQKFVKAANEYLGSEEPALKPPAIPYINDRAVVKYALKVFAKQVAVYERYAYRGVRMERPTMPELFTDNQIVRRRYGGEIWQLESRLKAAEHYLRITPPPIPLAALLGLSPSKRNMCRIPPIPFDARKTGVYTRKTRATPPPVQADVRSDLLPREALGLRKPELWTPKSPPPLPLDTRPVSWLNVPPLPVASSVRAGQVLKTAAKVAATGGVLAGLTYLGLNIADMPILSAAKFSLSLPLMFFGTMISKGFLQRGKPQAKPLKPEPLERDTRVDLAVPQRHHMPTTATEQKDLIKRLEGHFEKANDEAKLDIARRLAELYGRLADDFGGSRLEADIKKLEAKYLEGDLENVSELASLYVKRWKPRKLNLNIAEKSVGELTREELMDDIKVLERRLGFGLSEETVKSTYKRGDTEVKTVETSLMNERARSLRGTVLSRLVSNLSAHLATREPLRGHAVRANGSTVSLSEASGTIGEGAQTGRAALIAQLRKLESKRAGYADFIQKTIIDPQIAALRASLAKTRTAFVKDGQPTFLKGGEVEVYWTNGDANHSAGWVVINHGTERIRIAGKDVRRGGEAVGKEEPYAFINQGEFRVLRDGNIVDLGSLTRVLGPHRRP